MRTTGSIIYTISGLLWWSIGTIIINNDNEHKIINYELYSGYIRFVAIYAIIEKNF